MRSAALVVLLFVGGALTITVDGQRAEALFSDYLQAVSSYQRNETSPSALIANLSKADFHKVRQLLQKAEPRLIEAAALLHTEVAMSVSRPETADLQLAFGEAVLNLLPKDFEGTVAFRTRWYASSPPFILHDEIRKPGDRSSIAVSTHSRPTHGCGCSPASATR